jgi:hypothetical protein
MVLKIYPKTQLKAYNREMSVFKLLDIKRLPGFPKIISER